MIDGAMIDHRTGNNSSRRGSPVYWPPTRRDGRITSTIEASVMKKVNISS